MFADSFADASRDAADNIRGQFDLIWPSIRSAASHARLRDSSAPFGLDRPEFAPAVLVAATVTKAYHRHVYYTKEKYGGIAIICPHEPVLYWTRRFIAAFLALRDIEPSEWKADNLCGAMRSDRDNVPYSKTAMFYGLPFENIMSWDMSLMLSSAMPEESLFFCATHPSEWTVKPTQAGDVTRLEERVECFDLLKETAKLKRAK